MASSRLQTLGTVFTRVRDLMRSGIIKPAEKPIWYDVYEAFPPKKEPLYVAPEKNPKAKREDPVPAIFYKEDEIRAKFYVSYGMGPLSFDLSKPNFVSTCQRFVDKYTELKSRGDLDESVLFEETARALLDDGVLLKRRGGPVVSAVSSSPALKLPKDTFAEEESVAVDAEDRHTDISDSKVA